MAADIFISYSTQHPELTRALAAAVEAQYGVGSVWWDQAGLRAGDRFSEITTALDAAKAVVVVWTHGAVASDWVYAEATRAAAQRKVVPVRAADLDPKQIPLPFNAVHTCLAEDTSAVLAAIAKLLSGEASPLPSALPGQGFLLDPKREALPAHAGASRPASLLLAKHQLVPFDDFHGLRAAFVRWATEAPAHALGRVALGRLVHAPAGLGKTRALIEIAEELTRAHGWLAGFVPRDVRGAGRELSERDLERLIRNGRDAAGLMLIVDYAESRQDDVTWLADRLVERTQAVSKPARLVLLSRGSGVWWDELVRKSQSLQELCSLGGDAYDEIEIPETIGQHDRRSLFDASVKAFLAHRSSVIANSAALPPLSDALVRSLETESDYDRPLAVQIAALLHVAGHDAAEGRHSMAALLEKVLGLEYEHWDKALTIAGQPNWQAAVKHGVAHVTLVGKVDSKQAAEALIGHDPLFRDARDIDVPRVRHALSLIFPGAKEGLVGLEPDLIGEHHVLDIMTEALVDACLDWAGENPEQRQHILTVLNRATRSEHGAKAGRAEAQLDRLVKTRAAAFGGDLVNVAIETPGKLLDLCPAMQGELEHLDEAALAAIDDALPLRSLALMDLSLSVAERLAELARKEALAQNSDAAALAAADAAPDAREHVLDRLSARVSTLGIRLSNLGRLEEALAASQEAVEIHRRLAQTRPDAFLSDLAMSLSNTGAVLSNLGRREEALAAGQEAVDIYRRLAQTRPDAFLPNLATSLNNSGAMLSNLGRREEALAASQEAVDIRRRLAQTRPDAFLPDLASSLNNLGTDLSNLGRREEALAASQEAVDIYRRLAQTRPDAFLPDLAMSLNNSGTMLSDLGRREEALAASQEAVDIRRPLAQTRPDAFLPDLAMSLNNSGTMLSDLGRREEALAASQEAVDIHRRLAQTRPDAFLSDLAMSLGNSGAVRSNLGRREEALAAGQEAVDIYRRLAQTRPDAFLPNLATSLNNSGAMLSNLGRREEALAASQEAVDIRRPLAQTRPDAFLPDLASSLNNLGTDLSHLGRHEEALAASQEAVDIHRRLAQTRPDAFLPDLASSISVMSDALAALDRRAEAAQAASEALAILLPFVERYADAYRSLARTIVAGVRQYSEAAGTAPNSALLERAARALDT